MSARRSLRLTNKKLKFEEETEAGVFLPRSTLFDIPEEVIQTELLPYFGLNDLLRLRRACQRTKDYASEYLQRRYPSKKKIVVRLGARFSSCRQKEVDKEEEEAPLMSSFSREDKKIKMRMPTSYFRLIFSHTPLLAQLQCQNFLKRYGQQIKHLEVSHMSLPLEPGEFKFYEELPNLKSLRVEELMEDRNGPEEDEEVRGNEVITSLPLPKNLKQLKTLKIENHQVDGPVDAPSHFWKFVESCTSLEYLRLPELQYVNEELEVNASTGNVLKTQFKYLIPEYPQYIPVQVAQLRRILNMKNHTRLRYLDLAKLGGNLGVGLNKNLIQDFCHLCTNHDLKLVNVLSSYVRKIPGISLETIASHILSVRSYLDFPQCDPFKGITLPNVEEMKGIVWSDLPSHNVVLERKLTAGLFPGLRKLEIYLFMGTGISMEGLWGKFPNLEEITFAGYIEGVRSKSHEPIGDVMFMGGGTTSPFRQLTKLRKLSLPRVHQLGSLTDATFHLVLRNLRLREFYMASEKPITTFTSRGIMALLTGPFAQTIEIFPFHTWKLDNMGDEEFHALSRQFPCNSEV